MKGSCVVQCANIPEALSNFGFLLVGPQKISYCFLKHDMLYVTAV